MAEVLTATTEKRRSGANVVKLRGVLNGSSELHKVDIGSTQKLMINLAQIERVEASGQRDWSQWIASLVARNIKVELVSCSPAVVAMLNKDVEFAGKAIVKSVNARFTCAGCDSVADVLATLIDLRESKAAPSRDCDLCKVPMAMVDDPKSYFAFIANLPVPAKESAPEIERPSESRIARGSHQSVSPQTQGNTTRSSQKLVERRSSMSAFQTSTRGSRPSGMDLLNTGPIPRTVVVNSRAYWIIAIVLLALAAAVLAVLLMVI